jgi:hypothetical protein
MVGMRKLMGGAIAAVLMVMLTPAVAYADGELIEEETSLIDSGSYKMVTASCPDGTVVIGVGGRTRLAGGRAVLIGVVPNAELTEVTAYAQALPGHVAPWGVTATAMCAEPEEYEPVPAYGDGISSAVVTCPKGKVHYSTGYFLGRGLGVQYVNSLVPSVDGVTATVRAVGTVAPPRVNVIAVCGNIGYYPELYGRTEATVPLSAGVTTIGQAPPLSWVSWVVGAGVHTDRPGVFVDGFSPSAFYDTSTGLHAKGRVARLDAPLLRSTTSDGEVTFYGESIGSWY